MNPQAESPLNPGAPLLPSTGRRLSRRASIIGGVIAVLLLAAVAGLAWYLTRPASASVTAGGQGPGGPGGAGGRGGGSTVGVAIAEKTSIPVLLDALGTVTSQATVRVRPQVSGVLEKVLFREGQMVRAGELLATIDPRQFEMALQQAIGQRQRDEAQLESAKVTLQRFKILLDQDSIARQEVDTQAALVKQLEGTVVIDRATEGTARLNLGYTRVVAPVAGRVGLRAIDVGNVVSSSDANGVVLITQVSPIDVVFAVPQDRIGDLQQGGGAPVPIKATALDRTRSTVLDTGVFSSLDNQVDTTTGTVKAKARFNNTQLALFPSQFVNVQLQVRMLDNAVVVPVTAVRQGGNGDYVYVLNADRTVSLRTVTRGLTTVDKIVISNGLQPGERVITEGADRLKDGSRVTLAGDAPRSAASGAGGSSGTGQRQRRQRPDGAQGGPGADAPASAASGAAPTGGAPVNRAAGLGSAVGTGGAAASASIAPSTTNGPTPEQRQRMLDRVKDDPAALAQRQEFLAQLDKGDPAALARWRTMMENRRQGDRPAQ